MTAPAAFNPRMTGLPDLSDLLGLRQGLGIAHHIPGRIRLRLGSVIWDWAARQGLEAGQAVGWLDRVGGITGVRLNPAAACLVIDYEPRRLDPDWWETLVLGDDEEALALVLGLLAGNPIGE